jgi:hypothetical protein
MDGPEFGGWMCLIWTRCLRVLFQPPTLRPRKCLISPSLSEDRQMNIMQLSVKIVSKNHIVYTKLPAHPAMLNHVIILSSWWKLVQKPTLSHNLSQPSSRWTLQLTRSNHKFQPNITFVCAASAGRLITMSSCNYDMLAILYLIWSLIYSPVQMIMCNLWNSNP